MEIVPFDRGLTGSLTGRSGVQLLAMICVVHQGVARNMVGEGDALRPFASYLGARVTGTEVQVR